MSRKRISQLDPATDITASDLMQVVDVEDDKMANSGTNKKITAQLLANDLAPIATGSTTARKLKDRFADVVNVKDFGAVGDGVADDTAAIQAAFNNTNYTNAYIMSPAGYNYRITDTLVLDRDRFTLDFNNSGIAMDDPSGVKNILTVGNGTTQRNGIWIKNITFNRFQAATAGSAIFLNKTGVLYIEDNRFFGNNKLFNGITIYNGIMIHITKNQIDRCINNGIYVYGLNSSDRTIDVIIRENRIDYNNIGLKIWDFVEGIFCRDNIFYGQVTNAVNVDATNAASGLASFKFQENDFDGTTGRGFFIDKVTNVQITDNWFSSNGFNNGVASNLYIGANSAGFVVDGNQFYNALLDNSISLRADGPDVTITSNILNGGGGTGIYLGGTLYTVTGNNIKYFNTGINAFLANKYTINGNNFENTTTPIGVGGGSNQIVVDNNGGYCVGSKTYDPISIPAGGSDSTTVTVNGANFGDIVNVGFAQHGSGNRIIIYGLVSAVNTVTVIFYNPASFAIDLPSGVINVSVTKARNP